MASKKKIQTPYERAQHRVDKIKRFYSHLSIYVAVCLMVVLSKGHMKFILFNKALFGHPDVLNWFDWNLYGTPIIWGVVLIIHGVCVYFPNAFLSRSWEEKQIQKFMSEDQEFSTDDVRENMY